MKKELVSFEGVHCANCRAPMQGEYCHECGQSIHTVLRPMHHMVEDTLDMVFHVDGRVVHTVPPLLYRPGFLTMEYFSGRRQRYVAPFRLMFVLCLLAFFVCHLALNNVHLGGEDLVESQGTGEFAQDLTSTAVHARYDRMAKGLEDGLKGVQGEGDLGKATRKTLKRTLTIERDRANHRLTQLGAPLIEIEPEQSMSFKSKPVQISWLTDGMNASLNRAAKHAAMNAKGFMDGGEAGAEAQDRIVAGIFAVLPQTMFVLMPAFALFLKMIYLFKRRLYMEHLIVALHSHAFLFLTLFLVALLSMFRSWLSSHASWAGTIVGYIEVAFLIWAPVYLLVMQKRVYRQGWTMTVLKYFVVGWCYLWLLVIALSFAVVLGLAH